jgi:hypothetical protein
MGCIPSNYEKYLSFNISQLQFIDTFQFLPASLETLVENLKRDGPTKFKRLETVFKEEAERNLLLRKGVYPYSYMSNEARYAETQLPEKDAFFNDLREEAISEKDYEHAQNVWQTFNIKNMGEYTDLYVLSDVLLLADVFEAFRESVHHNFQLDVCHYFSAPGVSFDSMLLHSNVELELLVEIDSYQMFENALRGGVAMIAKRYSRANNRYIQDEFDETKPEKYLFYIDANGLYSRTMQEFLPTGGFRFLTSPQERETALKEIDTLPADSSYGYILEVDFDVPDSIHDLTADYPLAPEHLQVSEEMLSPLQIELLDNLDMLKGFRSSKVRKLVPNLLPKKNYVLHYRNLQFYKRMGLIVTKVHRIVEFKQAPFMRQFIDHCTEMRKKATNDVDKNLFKMMVSYNFN